MRFPFKSAATAWLSVAVISMAFMGVYAFMIVLSRAPGFNLLFTEQDFFRTALVTHVVLSVVIWFQAYILFLIYYVTSGRPSGAAEYMAAAGAFAGVILIVATPFTGPAFPMLNNYVPVLNRAVYLAGLGLFFSFAVAGAAMRAPLLFRKQDGAPRLPLAVSGPLAFAGLSLALGVGCIVFAWITLSGGAEAEMEPTVYFELLFWGGGHVLQFANTFGMMAVWALLVRRLAGEDIAGEKTVMAVLAVMAVFLIAAPVEYLRAPVESFESKRFFTSVKGWGVALGPIVFGAGVVRKLDRLNTDVLAKTGLLLSVILFAIGGLIALTIQGSDTRIPAHYHGVIGGVTIGYMTLALLAVRESGWMVVKPRWIMAQVASYGTGQALFVIGMFIGGLLGLARKTYGQAQVLDTFQKVFSMGVMGVGGFLAIMAGGLFVVIMLMSINNGKKSEA